MNHLISINDEDIAELEQILKDDLADTLGELRRANNLNRRQWLQKRIGVLERLMRGISQSKFYDSTLHR
jgi:hypothetical protein